MYRRLMAATVFSGLAVVALSVAQPPVNALPGYVVVRVDLEASLGGGGGVAGGGAPGLGAPPGIGGAPPGVGPGGGPPGIGGKGGGPGMMPPPGGGFPGGGVGFPGGGVNNQGPPADLSKSVVAVVPYKKLYPRLVYPKLRQHPTQNPAGYFVESGMGKAMLFADQRTIQLYPLKPGFSLEYQVRQKHTVWAKSKPIQAGFDLIVEAISYGMVDEAFTYSKELADISEARKDVQTPVTVANYLKAYKQLRDTITAALPDTGEASDWAKRLGSSSTTVEQSSHYALIHWGEQTISRDAVMRRMELLENNFKAFYLWHALGGHVLKMPDRKLVVVLAPSTTEMPKLREALDGNPIVSDSFFSPVHNIVVVSPERLDDVGRRFSKFAQEKYQQGWNREELLKGNPPALKVSESANQVMQVMTLALVDKYVEDEATIGMVTREGTRQLYAAAGLLPQHVNLPEWVENGASNLLHKPKGPIYNTDPRGKQVMTVGLTSGYGSPNYVLVRRFRQLLQAKEINSVPEELLMNTIMDKYFAAARDGVEIDPPPKKNEEGVAITGGGGGPPGAAGGPPGVGGPPGGARPGGGPPGAVGGGVGGAGPGAVGGGEGEGVPGGSAGIGIAGGGGQNPPVDPVTERRNLKTKLDNKAQVTSWGLTFFLAKKNLPQLIRFYAELGRMPRDMYLDKHEVLMLFCRIMGLTDATNPNAINQAAFKKFAEDWVDFLKVYSTWGMDIPVEAVGADPNSGIGGGNFGPGGGPPGGLPGGLGGLPGAGPGEER